MNGFGHKFRLSIWGESHGAEIGITIDGVRPGVALSVEDFTADLARRRSGAQGTTARHERDIPHLVSGVYEAHTTGAPLTILFKNEDVRSADYSSLKTHFRPSHADFVARERYGGWNDLRGGGHFSGRLTALLVAAGVVAKKMLPEDLRFLTDIVEIGGERDPQKFADVVAEAAAEGDSVGGIIATSVAGIPAGWGEPFFDSVEGLVAHLLFAIPGVKGVEFGAGFAAARMRGSEHNDQIINELGETKTNHAGGIVGGLTNSNPLCVRVAVKPTASIAREQMTFNRATHQVEPLSVVGRHDACIALRAGVVVEAAVAVVLADLMR